MNNGLREKRKRRRDKPIRKWSDIETKLLLDYLIRNKLEGQVYKEYFTKFIKESGINIDWKLVRNKVRNLRLAYQKSESQKYPNSGTSLNESETVQGTTNGMSSQYKILHELFHDPTSSTLTEAFEFDPLSDESIKSSSPSSSHHFYSSIKDEINQDSTINNDDNENDGGHIKQSPSPSHKIKYSVSKSNILYIPLHSSPLQPEEAIEPAAKRISNNNRPQRRQLREPSISSLPEEEAADSEAYDHDDNEQEYNDDDNNDSHQSAASPQRQHSAGTYNRQQPDEGEKQRGKYSRTAIQDLLYCQKQRNNFQQAKLDLEERKFTFDQEKTLRELELKEKQIESGERLKILEIESKERIALKELEYKYERSVIAQEAGNSVVGHEVEDCDEEVCDDALQPEYALGVLT